MLELGGLCFEIGPEGLLTASEREVLANLGAAGERSLSAPEVFRLSVVDARPRERGDGHLKEGQAAVVTSDTDGRLKLSHACFEADVAPFDARATLRRHTEMGFPLSLTLRVALAARLPVVGGVPLHAAGLVIDGEGVVFFGPSGAGKSTLASSFKDLVLSDELVAVLPVDHAFQLASTGTWGTLDRGGACPGRYPVRALIALAKGPGFRLELVPDGQALRELIAVTMVPPSPRLWALALGILARLVSQIPVYRMAWSPDSPPWSDLRGALPDIDRRGGRTSSPPHSPRA